MRKCVECGGRMLGILVCQNCSIEYKKAVCIECLNKREEKCVDCGKKLQIKCPECKGKGETIGGAGIGSELSKCYLCKGKGYIKNLEEVDEEALKREMENF